MRVSTLTITGFRNLEQIDVSCAPDLNLVIGANASGKTSLLEALYFLGWGRSFRTRQPNEMINDEASLLRVVAAMRDSEGHSMPVGVERNARTFSARVGGTTTRSLAELARRVPALLLNPDSHRLFEDGPRQRRRFMDWGLFHAEPAFADIWRRYETALRHRNAALRSGLDDRTVDAWDGELSIAAAKLDTLREAFCKALEGALLPFCSEILGQVSITLNYRRGWPLEPFKHDFIGWLHANRTQDRRQGYTRSGPHRADFAVRITGRSPSEALSHGQQKLLIIALVLAQAMLYQQHVKDSCIMLIDDLPAELDANNRQRIMQTLVALDLQLFITAIEPELLDTRGWPQAKKFYLKAGRLVTDL
ncbi:MAG: DNA replication/repair protein RecF [Candidatus Contendobacter odensis]|uniref:DNA replication and repair protein RecF n=1 Tax=Candidatus Contendibacter odensensis TaxID=1400860 RepID=A0A2G6PGQ6_9GAMM|nr:MAG: DNA replication/repair protein RecF [Candidatus Contendobacter odensis]